MRSELLRVLFDNPPVKLAFGYPARFRYLLHCVHASDALPFEGENLYFRINLDVRLRMSRLADQKRDLSFDGRSCRKFLAH